jgi:hypothetical protein
MMPPYLPQATLTLGGDLASGHIGSYHRYLSYGWDFSGVGKGSVGSGGSYNVPTTPFSVDRVDQYTPFGRTFNFGILGYCICQC